VINREGRGAKLEKGNEGFKVRRDNGTDGGMFEM